MRVQTILIAAAAACAWGCGSKSTPPAPTPIGNPTLTCPSNIEVISHNQQAPTVVYDVPTGSGGVPPISVACTPASGTTFNAGATTVTCVATDTRQKQGSCTFMVTITAIPQLSKTTFMAFGDSTTEGKTSLIGPGIIVSTPYLNQATSYVEDLNLKLTNRYQDQLIKMIPEGEGGEQTGEAKLRLPGELNLYKPDVVLLLDGANDMLNTPDTPGINSAADALTRMVNDSKAHSAVVFIATIPMKLGSKTTTTILASTATLNSRIKTIASQTGAVLVDLAANLPASAIGSDGVHPTAAGYDLMSDEWLKAISANLEIKPAQ